jgi:SPP1 gp7 family putative phage head morphogenesis protein
MQAIYPDDLETQYSENFSQFIDDVNNAFLDVLLDELTKKDAAFVSENVAALVSRNNALPVGALRKRLASMFDRFTKSEKYRKIFKSAVAIFKRADDRIVAGVQKEFKKQSSKNTPFPNLKERPSKAVEKAITENVDLIKKITKKQFDQLEKVVVKSVSGRATLDQTVEEISHTFKRGRAYAEFVARDQLAKAHASISQERQIEAGFPGYIWETVNDSKTRESHRKMHGGFHLWSKAPLVDGENVHPGEAVNCRCIAKGAFGPEKKTSRKFTTFDDAFATAKRQKHQSFAVRRARGEDV